MDVFIYPSKATKSPWEKNDCVDLTTSHHPGRYSFGVAATTVTETSECSGLPRRAGQGCKKKRKAISDQTRVICQG